ncbi:Hypothetical_protein [Hexamita inflata]|uniref:Hypothetical_protein n=1 Tax=Hexamita inflata TaxID=28002 RepID=A0AA86RD79_9EUKA|nr:Hypothetical protein HINF_LOCUS57954 [Hexamita inflata]
MLHLGLQCYMILILDRRGLRLLIPHAWRRLREPNRNLKNIRRKGGQLRGNYKTRILTYRSRNRGSIRIRIVVQRTKIKIAYVGSGNVTQIVKITKQSTQTIYRNFIPLIPSKVFRTRN